MIAFFRRLSGLWAPFTVSKTSLYAASAVFYLLLSLLPAALFLLQLLSRFPTARDAAMEFLFSALPSGFVPLAQTVEESLTPQIGTAFLSLSVLATLWSASKGMLALDDGFHALLGLRQTRSFLLRRLLSIVHFLLLALSLVAAFSLLVLSRWLFVSLTDWFPGASHFWALLNRLRVWTVLLPLWILFSLMYTILPTKTLPLRCRLWGSAAAVLGWLLFSILFSLYMEQISGLKGGLGFLILTLLWLHMCMQMLLWGGILAKLLADGGYHPLRILRHAFFPSCS